MEKRRLADKAANEIAERIQRGIWVGRLPGVRELSRNLVVSPMTAAAAVRILETAGVVAPAEPGKRRAILTARPKLNLPKAGLPGCRIGLLSSRKSWEDGEPNDRDVLKLFVNELEARSAEVEVRFDPRVFSTATPGKHLEEVLEERPMDFWIVAAPSGPIAGWFAAHDVPRLFLGGAHRALGTTADYTLTSKVTPIIKTLVNYGHKRIVLPIPESWHHDAEQLTAFERTVHRLLTEAGVMASAFNTPRYGSTPDSLQEALERTFAHTPPSAVITNCLPEYLRTAGFLQQRSLRVPDDVSVVTLGWQPESDWAVPKPTSFKPSQLSLVRESIAYIESVLRDGPPPQPLLIEGDGELIPGDSIARVQRRGRNGRVA